jgi:hypothetical protein
MPICAVECKEISKKMRTAQVRGSAAAPFLTRRADFRAAYRGNADRLSRVRRVESALRWHGERADFRRGVGVCHWT